MPPSGIGFWSHLQSVPETQLFVLLFIFLSLPRALTRLFLSAFAQNHACLPQAGLRAKTHFGVQARLRASGMALGVDARPPQ